MALFYWEKIKLSTRYQLFMDRQPIGELNYKLFGGIAQVDFNNHQYFFETEGLLKRRMLIIDRLNKKELGVIHFNTWINKAQIELNGSSYLWKRKNLFSMRWKIYDNIGQLLYNTSGLRNGQQVVSNQQEMLVLICGIIAINHARRSGAI